MDERKNWIGIRVTDDEKEAIRGLANVFDVSVSELIRMSLNKLME